MLLRPHHLLCIQKFTGHGYDAAFTAHMKTLTASLRKEPETTVTLRSGADDVCAACPHCCDGICDTQEKVSAMDAAVCTACSLHENMQMSWHILAEKTKTSILQTETFCQICSCCQWYWLCRRTEDTNGTNCT